MCIFTFFNLKYLNRFWLWFRFRFRVSFIEFFFFCDFLQIKYSILVPRVECDSRLGINWIVIGVNLNSFKLQIANEIVLRFKLNNSIHNDCLKFNWRKFYWNYKLQIDDFNSDIPKCIRALKRAFREKCNFQL